MNDNNIIYFDSFGVEHIPKEILKNRSKQKYTKYVQNTSIRFDNMWIFLYWIYWFYVTGKCLLDYTN